MEILDQDNSEIVSIEEIISYFDTMYQSNQLNSDDNVKEIVKKINNYVYYSISSIKIYELIFAATN